ncbi:putative methyltransferase DDB_G0268948 [Aplysia californica]|uniref:Methyltransferase DDB_G0268948 n=1 Tax=Aplysia californica TaxID=6500 RepID=A0ABM0JXN0_APLCA|nr:putative methyltransferase DDB_G0268948 [Aplysia californica]
MQRSAHRLFLAVGKKMWKSSRNTIFHHPRHFAVACSNIHTTSTQSSEDAGSTSTKFSNPYDVKEIIDHYPKHRPTYADDTYVKIREFCEENNAQFDLALDMACGSGQATVPLAGIYKQVVGVDGSALHVEKAPRDLNNITYHVADCNLPLNFIQSGTVDLITVASAIQWLHTDKYLRHISAVL